MSNMAQLEHLEAIERRLWGAADTLRDIHTELECLNAEATSLAATIKKNSPSAGQQNSCPI